MKSFAWHCPFCGHYATIGDANYSTIGHVPRQHGLGQLECHGQPDRP